jgi:ATP-dependent RNA helicase RhlE
VKRQNLLFSATFSNEIKKLADQLLNAPQLIEVAKRNTAAETVKQCVYKVAADAKRPLLEHLVRSGELSQVLCFVRTKHGASRLARQLVKDGFTAESIHGDKSQQARMEALDAFKDGKLQVLVATDVAARGLDIDALPHVLNYELPHVPEDYIHRIGRTGRAGATGDAIAFVSPDEEKYLVDIEKLLKKPVPLAVAAGFDAAATPLRADRPQQRRDKPEPRAPEVKREPRAPEVKREPRAPEVEREARPPESARQRRPRGEKPQADEQKTSTPEIAQQQSPAPVSHAKPRPIAALLMKRRTPESEKV